MTRAATMTIPIARLAPFAALLPFVIGCAHAGHAPGSSVGEPRKPAPVELRHVAEIPPGTPIRVFLPDGDSTGGFFLGATELDASGISGRAPAIRLGVGDPGLTDRMFESGTVLSASTGVQLRDTVVFVMDRVKRVLVPGREYVPPRRVPAIVIVVGALALVVGLLGLTYAIWAPHSELAP